MIIEYNIGQDCGTDNDDSVSNIHRKYLIANGLLKTKVSVATLAPELKRAQLIAGEFVELGLDIPVYVGSRLIPDDATPPVCHYDVPYLATTKDVYIYPSRDIRVMLENEKDNSVTFTVQAGMTDFATMLEQYPELVSRKAKQVVIMGGVIPQLVGKYLVPNDANNNTFAWSSACYVYARCQELKIPMVIVTRNAAYAVKLEFAFYDQLENTGHIIGKALKQTQAKMMEHLWIAANEPANSKLRGTLPPNRNRQWFLATFCDGNVPSDVKSSDSIWKYVKYFSLYDSLNLFAAFEEFQHLFDPVIFKVNGVDHKVIGLTPDQHGIKNVAEMRKLLTNSAIEALTN